MTMRQGTWTKSQYNLNNSYISYGARYCCLQATIRLAIFPCMFLVEKIARLIVLKKLINNSGAKHKEKS